MRAKLLMTIFLPHIISCEIAHNENNCTRLSSNSRIAAQIKVLPRQIQQIAVPAGFQRIASAENSFSTWLRRIKLKTDPRVFLYDGSLKKNQNAQYAVLDVPVGKKDLQQCADAVMRLRASFLLEQRRFSEISFSDNDGKKYAYNQYPVEDFEKYLEKVYSFCGTLSLEKQLQKVKDFNEMQPGDVFIRGGSPGHAVIVADMAKDVNGRKIYLLAQSYMPAQDIHVLKNPMDAEISPWYELRDNALIITPEWDFRPEQLRSWPR